MMKSALFLFNIAALACLGAAGQWDTQPKLDCIRRNWSSIKNDYDPSIPILSEEQKGQLGSLVQGQQLTNSPNDSQLRSAIASGGDDMASQLVGKYCANA
ncbi:hypothetical protein BJ944DRAFT_260480 [Cunninghamella echinulata]|nr:hypothetical protein BJ944DRAFT_260480 [Cunninghamella echinulata]